MINNLPIMSQSKALKTNCGSWFILYMNYNLLRHIFISQLFPKKENINSFFNGKLQLKKVEAIKNKKEVIIN